jgi:hypothetical protein
VWLWGERGGGAPPAPGRDYRARNASQITPLSLPVAE